jgi:hypothetical protein
VNDPTAEKRWATAQARLALRGVTSLRIDGDSGRPIYVSSLGPWIKIADSLDELERFVAAIEGTTA